ncbi:MAG: diguanylate cyclase [Bacillota bacterium]|nr:diguanylate cyclase [Bacillota bacterium]
MHFPYTNELCEIFEEIVEIDFTKEQALLLHSRSFPQEAGKSCPILDLWNRRLPLIHPADQDILSGMSAWLQPERINEKGLQLNLRMYKLAKRDYSWISLYLRKLSSGKLLLSYLETQSSSPAQENGRELLNLLPMGVIVYEFSPEPRPIFISENFQDMLGYRLSELPELKLFRKLKELCLKASRDRESFELIYFFNHKDGHVLTLRINGVFLADAQGHHLCSIIIGDASISQQLQQELERYRILQENAEFITFEYLIEEDSMHFYINSPGCEPHELRDEKYLQEKRYSRRIFPENQEEFLQAMEDAIRQPKQQHQAELLIGLPGKLYWYRALFSGQQDEKGQVCRVTGHVKNIQKEMDSLAHMEELRYMAEIDQGSGLLNKSAAENRVKSYLAEEGRSKNCALLILDLDDFKQINDKLGHLQGDAVLYQCGQSLKASFREKDIIGRIGGDEFMIFLKDIPDAELARKKALQVLQTLSHIQLDGVPPIHGSLGISMAAPGEQDFRAIFQAADKALYRAKKMGKNCFAFHMPEQEQ